MSCSIMSPRFAARWMFAVVLSLAAPCAFAGKDADDKRDKGDDSDSLVYPVNARPFGLDYAEWSARHWQWLYSLPVDANPLFDTADCSAGQSGKVWFIGGTYAPTDMMMIGNTSFAAVTRTCEIPEGKALFFPLVDAEASTLEGNGVTEADLRGVAEFFASLIIPADLSLEIDGKSIKHLANHEFESPLFTFGPLPANNVLLAGGTAAALKGATSPSVSDGYFVMLKALPVGHHTIHFTSTLDATSVGGPVFVQDVTYHLTVVPRRHDDK